MIFNQKITHGVIALYTSMSFNMKGTLTPPCSNQLTTSPYNLVDIICRNNVLYWIVVCVYVGQWHAVWSLCIKWCKWHHRVNRSQCSLNMNMSPCSLNKNMSPWNKYEHFFMQSEHEYVTMWSEHVTMQSEHEYVTIQSQHEHVTI